MTSGKGRKSSDNELDMRVEAMSWGDQQGHTVAQRVRDLGGRCTRPYVVTRLKCEHKAHTGFEFG